jgi:non-specific serine/threonine protein kinase
MLPSFPDGVWFVDYAPLVDAQRVVATAATALGARESAETSAYDALRTAITGKQVLLVLDNCEHLLGDVAQLVDGLLTDGESLRIVATTREGLGLEGERLFAVRSMSVAADPGALEQSDAVRLFVDRALAARRDFAIGPDNAAVVAEICRRLDGIPLAIELAAARVKALSVEQIRSRLDDRFKLLTGGRSAVPRQQTLLATIQWSYDQLLADEQALLRALSVFAGGWTLESATAIAGHGVDEFAILDLLTRLIDKSLVLVDQTGGSEARYGMLETVRQFGLERLLESGESDAVRDRHATVFSELAERFYSEKFTREEFWGQRLTWELDNLRAALSFLRHRDPERYLSLVGALGYFWWGRSHVVEGRDHINAAIGLVSPRPVRRAYARALRGMAMLAAYAGGQSDARALMETTLAMWRELGDALEVAGSLEWLGWAQFLASEDEAGRATFTELLRISRDLADPVLVNRANVGLGQVLVALSRIDEARPIAREIIDWARRTGDRRSEHSGFHYLADCALIEGNATESLGLYRESLMLAEAIGDRVETSFEVEGIGMSLAALGHHAPALRLIGAMRAERARLGVNLQVRFWDALLERYVIPVRAALGPERTEAAEASGRELTFEDAVAAARLAAS